MNKPLNIVISGNNGENQKLRQCCSIDDWKFGINFDYTAGDTPQENSEAEVGLLNIANQGQAMMIT